MSLRMGLLQLLVGSALIAISQIASAQAKVAVINLQQAVFESAEIKHADAELQAKLKPDQDRAVKLQNDLAALAQSLQANAGKLSQQQEADMQAQGQKMQRDLQHMQDDLQAAADGARQELLPKASQKMHDVVGKLAEAKGLDLVVDTTAAPYFKATLDITAEAIAAYDKAYPVAAKK